MAKLYELSSSFQQVQEMIESGQEGLQDTLESIDMAFSDKLESIGKVSANLKANISAFKEEEKRLADRRKTIENNLKSLEGYAENALRTTGKQKVEAGTFTFAIQNNPPSVDILSESAIPRKYLIKQEPTIDKTAIKQALKDGEVVPGAEMKQTESLRIR